MGDGFMRTASENHNWIDCPDCFDGYITECDECDRGLVDDPLDDYTGTPEGMPITCKTCDGGAGEECSTCNGGGRILAPAGFGY